MADDEINLDKIVEFFSNKDNLIIIWMAIALIFVVVLIFSTIRYNGLVELYTECLDRPSVDWLTGKYG